MSPDNQPPSEDELRAAGCWTEVDRVSRDSEMTEFKQIARYRQHLWREEHGHPIGEQLIPKRNPPEYRPSGTRLEATYARTSGANFITEAARNAAEHRLAEPQKHQTLDPTRLWTDLLSSMPMCFNLFGSLWADPGAGQTAVDTLWPDLGVPADEVIFEWSPGRLDRQYLNNRTAFDVALFGTGGDGRRGVIGIETKYHEHAVPEKPPVRSDDPANDRLNRYEEVAASSGVFQPGAVDTILGTELQQIWLDHLLVLSMLQHPTGEWAWGRSVLIAPQRNVSFARAAEKYRALLVDDSTFDYLTLESVLDAGVLPSQVESTFRDRYVW